MEAVVVAVLVVAFATVAVVAGLAVRRIWSATEPPARPSERES